MTYFAAVSCSHDDLPPRSEEASIPIIYNARAYTHEAQDARTRGASDLTNLYDGFYVRSYKTMNDKSTVEVMPNYSVEYSDGKWEYDGLESITGNEQFLKFWDLSAASYKFAAIAPIPDENWKNFFDTAIIDTNCDIDIKGIKGNMSSIYDKTINSTGAPDWIVAQTIRRGVNSSANLLDYDNIVENDQTIDDNGGASTVFDKPKVSFDDVPLMFHHIFALVDFVAYATTPINVRNFQVYISDDTPDDEIINQGCYTTQHNDSGDIIGWYDTKAATVEETAGLQDPKRFADYPYLPAARAVGTDAEHPVLLASHIQIPQEWATPGRELKVTIVTTEEDENGDPVTYNGVIILTPDNNGTNSWIQNVHYTYILKINTEGSNEVILFDVDMEKWMWKEGNKHTEDQTDW